VPILSKVREKMGKMRTCRYSCTHLYPVPVLLDVILQHLGGRRDLGVVTGRGQEAGLTLLVEVRDATGLPDHLEGAIALPGRGRVLVPATRSARRLVGRDIRGDSAFRLGDLLVIAFRREIHRLAFGVELLQAASLPAHLMPAGGMP
jgi:hypothetical protein